ncbi:TolC family protein [Fluviicola sp.]|uniref:TolC family protein n=1 Tax=Fluviicola sp. TaxID=1917219 RepID=UPI003D270B1B
MKAVFLFIFTLGTSWAQDTIQQFTLDQFLMHVKENHPVALVATNQVEMAELFIRQSKGSFDPVLLGGVDQKVFNGTTYYSTLSTGIKIPTRLGIDVKAMGDWNRGTYLNPQDRVPDGGLTYLGFEAQLGRGMFTDERRTQIKRAQIALNQSYVEQRLTLNELLYEAGQAFIQWQEQEAQYQLAKEGLDFAETRFDQLLSNAALGDRPYIDTVEASAQLFLRKMEVEQRKLTLLNAQIAVENFLWEKGILPLQLDSSIVPELLSINKPKIAFADSMGTHPAVRYYDWKLSDLKLERKLKVEQLKPQLSVNYNLLTPASDFISTNYTWSNYKWGATFYMPILLRKERNSLKMTNVKIENTQLEQQLKQRELRTKQLQIRNEWNTAVTQAQMAETIASRYRQLADAERTLFLNGESSLFLVNAREISYLSAQGKMIETLSKTNKLNLSEQFIAGKLGL